MDENKPKNKSEIEITPQVRDAILIIQQGMIEGVKHFRESDNKLLETPGEVVGTLVDGGSVNIQFPSGTELQLKVTSPHSIH